LQEAVAARTLAAILKKRVTLQEHICPVWHRVLLNAVLSIIATITPPAVQLVSWWQSLLFPWWWLLVLFLLDLMFFAFWLRSFTQLYLIVVICLNVMRLYSKTVCLKQVV
jgi:hypothetical protein